MPVTDDDDYDGPVSMAATQSTASKAEQRKSNKPIMEKRRRARINHCLNELKTLILNAMKKDPARHSKLEKADILEMTVKHLQNVQRQQLASAVATDPTVITKFRSGFDECAAEVTRYIARLEGVDTGVKQRLSAHLHRCVSSLQQMAAPCAPNTASSHDDNNNSNQRALLIPSRLPTGEIALVLPNYNSFIATAPSSAFTAIKPPNDNQRSFQPFQVEIPNSQLTAHISFPEGIGRKSPAMPSPKTFDLQPQIIPEQKPQVSSTEGFDRLLLKPNTTERRDLYERTKVIEVDKRTEPISSPAYKYQQRQMEGIERLHPTQIHQKPNPNFVLNPKLHSSPHKFIRNSDVFKGRPVDLQEPPFKKFAVSTSTEHRMSVIVSDCSDSTSAEVSINLPVPYQNEPDTSQRDMWRPW